MKYYQSEAYQGPKYFSYNGKTLWELRLEREKAHTRHGCVLPAKEYTGNCGKELPDSYSKKGRQKRVSARVRMFGQREVRADDGAGEGMRRGKRASSKPV